MLRLTIREPKTNYKYISAHKPKILLCLFACLVFMANTIAVECVCSSALNTKLWVRLFDLLTNDVNKKRPTNALFYMSCSFCDWNAASCQRLNFERGPTTLNSLFLATCRRPAVSFSFWFRQIMDWIPRKVLASLVSLLSLNSHLHVNSEAVLYSRPWTEGCKCDWWLWFRKPKKMPLTDISNSGRLYAKRNWITEAWTVCQCFFQVDTDRAWRENGQHKGQERFLTWKNKLDLSSIKQQPHTFLHSTTKPLCYKKSTQPPKNWERKKRNGSGHFHDQRQTRSSQRKDYRLRAFWVWPAKQHPAFITAANNCFDQKQFSVQSGC